MRSFSPRSRGSPGSSRSRSRGIVRSLRSLDLKKHPSISETIDWARTLVLLGIESVDAETASATLHILLKYRSDIEVAAKELAAVSAS